MTTGKTWKRMSVQGCLLLLMGGLVGTAQNVGAAEHQGAPSARRGVGNPLFGLPRTTGRRRQA